MGFGNTSALRDRAERNKKDKEAKPVSAEKPSWWDEDAQGEWTDDLAQGYGAFQSVLGREITATSDEVAGIKNWANFLKDKGYAATQAQLALSAEARAKGVDPAAFGNAVVDPATLSGKDKEWHSAWAEANPGETFYEGMLDQLRWQQPLYSVDVYRGMNDGSITVENGVTTVTPEAIERYGEDNLLFWHGGRGQLVRVPEGSNLWIQEQQSYAGERPEGFTDEQWANWLEEQNSGGYTLVNTRPEQKKGLGDYIAGGLEDIGLGSDAVDFVMAAVPVVAAMSGGVATGAQVAAATAPMAAPFAENALGIDEAYFATDPLGVNSGIHWGTEGTTRNLEGAKDVLGSNAETIQGVGRAVVGTALSLFNPAVGLGFNALRSANSAASGAQSWGDAFIQTGIAAASSGLMIGDPGIANAFINAANTGASTALQAGLTGRDPATGERTSWDDALKQGAVSAVASFAVSGFNAAVSPKTDWGKAFSGAAAGAGSSYLSGSALGMEGDALEQSVIGGAASGAISGLLSKADSGPGGWEGFTNWATDFDVGAPNFVTGAQGWDAMTPWSTRKEDAQRARTFLRPNETWASPLRPGLFYSSLGSQTTQPIKPNVENNSVKHGPLVIR